MKYIQLIFVFVLTSLIVGCNSKNKTQITNSKDYEDFLALSDNISLKSAKEGLIFWESKLKNHPDQYPYQAKLATANSSVFMASGNINHLKKAENNLLFVNQKTNFNNASYLRSLARNYISQHRFKDALQLLTKAEYNGEKLEQTHFMLVDVYLELGNLAKVEKYLSKVKNMSNFDYLIRLSKYNDHIGNLNNAIKYLEKALVIAEESNQKMLLEWNYTNLADYYGHAGKLQDSYNSYLKALALNPNNSYAKKGIAWIVFSYERNPEEALRILKTITKENTSPDYFLLKAEIAEFMGNTAEREKEIQNYFTTLQNENYGVMYAKYNVLLYAENEDYREKAITIAKQEVEERPTAQSYDLLAWAYYKNEQTKKAIAITREYVLGKTFEPEALLHAAIILKNDDRFEITSLKKELIGAIYELGPTAEQTILNL